MVRRLFLDHPQSVGETYWEHLRAAMGFAGLLFVAACACALHALIPGTLQRSASRIVARLHDRMVRNRRRREPANVADEMDMFDYVI